jgi:prephenate dehydratase
MEQLTVGYLGLAGSYSHQAAEAIFPGAAAVGYARFDQVLANAEAGKTAYAVIPVENSVAGRVTEVYRLLLSTNLHIVAEHLERISHCLIGNPGWLQSLGFHDVQGGLHELPDDDLAAVCNKCEGIVSHPQAIMQCRSFIEKYLDHATVLEAADTASAVKRVAREHASQRILAISSQKAAEIYGAVVLKANIEDVANNATRFLVLSRQENKGVPRQKDAAWITTILFETKHEPGALIHALGAFSTRGINLTKLETYMASSSLRQPTFYVDIGSPIDDDAMRLAMADFSKQVERYRVLGSYPASSARGQLMGFLPT